MCPDCKQLVIVQPPAFNQVSTKQLQLQIFVKRTNLISLEVQLRGENAITQHLVATKAEYIPHPVPPSIFCALVLSSLFWPINLICRSMPPVWHNIYLRVT